VTLYRSSLALFTDLYQLTMAYGYWKKGFQNKEAVFHLFFRKKPFGGSFAIAAGLEPAIDFIKNFHYDPSDLSYLEKLRDSRDKPLFEKKFLDYLSTFSFTCNIDAVREGTPIFPTEPLLRVEGPILEAQILESPLLNIINFQTLIATKSARICYAAKPDPVVEFGMRRAQGIDGALSAARAAFIGGCPSTSDVLAGKLLGIPVKGTHAHSWIMAFKKEEDSFQAFAEVFPDESIFLIDTYDSIMGVKKAIEVAKKMRQDGNEMVGVRLDSGDLAHLSIEIRHLLDEAGFKDAKIMASNELDEFIIQDLKHQGARIDIWGVGTNLVTGKDQPALDGVYKLAAIRDKGGEWEDKLKISEQTIKTTTPGLLQIRRFFDGKSYLADMIYDIRDRLQSTVCIIDAFDSTRQKFVSSDIPYQDLLIPMLRKGKPVHTFPSLLGIQEYAKQELEKFHPSIRRFLFPHPYFAGLEKSRHKVKLSLIEEIKNQ